MVTETNLIEGESYAIYISHHNKTLAVLHSSRQALPKPGDVVLVRGSKMVVTYREWCYNSLEDGPAAFITLHTRQWYVPWYKRFWGWLRRRET